MDDSEAKEIHSRLRDLYGSVEHTLDQQALLSNGVQTVVSQQMAADTKLDSMQSVLAGVVSDGKWIRALLFLLLIERIATHVFETAPAKALFSTVTP